MLFPRVAPRGCRLQQNEAAAHLQQPHAPLMVLLQRQEDALILLQRQQPEALALCHDQH